MLLSVGVGGGGRVELGAGGAGDAGAGAHGVAQPRVCRRTGKGKRRQRLTLAKQTWPKRYSATAAVLQHPVPRFTRRLEAQGAPCSKAPPAVTKQALSAFCCAESEAPSFAGLGFWQRQVGSACLLLIFLFPKLP